MSWYQKWYDEITKMEKFQNEKTERQDALIHHYKIRGRDEHSIDFLLDRDIDCKIFQAKADRAASKAAAYAPMVLIEFMRAHLK